MVIKVIGRSKDPDWILKDPEIVQQIDCRNCGAILEYTRSDTFVHRYSACGSSESDRRLECPECESFIYIGEC